MNIFESAEYAESLSICKKRKVGSAILLNNKVVSIGFNHGMHENCNCDESKENPDCLHAEIVSFFADDDFCFKGGDMAVTYLPCLNCAKMIIKNGIKRVYYRDHREEDHKQSGIKFLVENGVDVRYEWRS